MKEKLIAYHANPNASNPQTRRLIILKLIALLGVFSLVVPAMIVIRILLFKEFNNILYISIGLLFTYLGYTLGLTITTRKSDLYSKISKSDLVFYILGRNPSESFISNLAAHFTILGVILLSIIFFKGKGIQSFVESVFISIFYSIGLRANYREFGHILSIKKSYFGVFIFGMYIFVASYFKEFYHLKNLFSIFSVIFIFTSFLVQNQFNLDTVLIKKDSNSINISHSIRKFNIYSIISFSIILVLVFNLKNIMIFLIKSALKILRFIIWLIFKFLELIFPTSPVQDSSTKSRTPFTPELSPGSTHPIADIILKVVFFILIVYIFYRYFPIFLKKILRLLSYILQYFKKLLSKSAALKSIECSDYRDEIYTITPQKNKKNFINIKNLFISNASKNMSPAEKIRHYYSSIISILKAKGVKISSYDTTGEIYRKSLEFNNISENFRSITKLYNEVRYDDKIPIENEVKSAELDYSISINLLKNK